MGVSKHILNYWEWGLNQGSKYTLLPIYIVNIVSDFQEPDAWYILNISQIFPNLPISLIFSDFDTINHQWKTIITFVSTYDFQKPSALISSQVTTLPNKPQRLLANSVYQVNLTSLSWFLPTSSTYLFGKLTYSCQK